MLVSWRWVPWAPSALRSRSTERVTWRDVGSLWFVNLLTTNNGRWLTALTVHDIWGICSSFPSRICGLMKWFHQMTSWQTFVRKEHLPDKTTDAPSMDESLTVLGHGKLCWSIHKTLMIPGDDMRWFSCVLCRSFWSLQKWEHGIHLIYKLIFSIIFQPASLDCRTSPSRYSRPPLLATVEPSVDSISPRMDPTNQPEMNLEEVGTILRDLGFSASHDHCYLLWLCYDSNWGWWNILIYHGMSLYVSMLPFEEDECFDHMIKLIWDDQVFFRGRKIHNRALFQWKDAGLVSCVRFSSVNCSGWLFGMAGSGTWHGDASADGYRDWRGGQWMSCLKTDLSHW